LTYDEALALVLSKNGIKYKSKNEPDITPESDNDKTIVIKKASANQPSIEKIKPAYRDIKEKTKSEKKKTKEKKPGLVSLIKQGINSILEDDDDDDDDDSLDPAIFDAIKASQQPLQFGKDYDVKKKI
jgi:hypothetical protein